MTKPLATANLQELLKRKTPELLQLADQLKTSANAKPLRIAVLSNFTTQYVCKLLNLFLSARNVAANIYAAPYGTLAQQILTDESELYAFKPDVVLLLNSQYGLQQLPLTLQPAEEVQQLADAEVKRYQSYWQKLQRALKCHILQSNYELPIERPCANYEGSIAYSRLTYMRTLNHQLVAGLLPGVTLFDWEYLASYHGNTNVYDAKMYLLTKQPFSFDFLPLYANTLARLVTCQLGKLRKCLVVDLDNTLWGGIVGEDGIDGLKLGYTDPEGEAFIAFQKSLKQLKERGILLAVCSKNDENVAKEVFEQHPDMHLKLDDIACFVANWQDKATNLLSIAKTLNIGLDAMVFFDDNPAERHIVRQNLPEVAVVDVPEDPSDYGRALDQGHFFETSEITQDAANRTAFFVQNKQRGALLEHTIDYDDYLKSLKLKAEIKDIDTTTLARVAELVKRTNQWNLRTKRYDQSTIQNMLANKSHIGFCLAVEDRFGRYGIVSVALLEKKDAGLFIDTWLMSCRVIKKGVEQLAFEHIIKLAKQMDAKHIVGEYIETAKNSLVKDLLANLGFEAIEKGEWQLSLEKPLPPIKHFIAQGEVS